MPAVGATGELPRDEETLRVLGQAARAFAAATHDRALLHRAVARTLVEGIGGVCALFTLSDGGDTLALSVQEPPDAALRLDGGAAFGSPLKLASSPGWRRVIVTGESLLLPSIVPDAARDDAALDLLARAGGQGCVALALRLHGRSVGLVALARAPGEARAYDEADRELGQVIADLAELALGSARAAELERAARASGIFAGQRDEQIALLLAHCPAAFAMFDQDMRYVGASRRWLANHAQSEADVLGQRHYDVNPTVPERWKEAHRRALAGAVETSEEDTMLRTDGSARWVRWEIRPWHTREGTVGGIVIFTEDITAQKRERLALRASEERFREIADNMRDVFWVTNAAKTEMLYINRAYEEIWGRTRESLYASPIDWLEAIHPEDRPQVERAARTRQVADAYQETYRVLRADGTTRWIHDRAFPIRSASGDVVRIVGIASDITQERMLADQFRQAQKMEAVGRLAGGVAHDFNNILSIILSCGDVLLEALAAEDPMRPDVEEIRRAGERGGELTRQLLQFSRKQMIEPCVTDVNEVLAGMQQMLGRLIGEDVELVVRLHAEGSVLIDRSCIEQIVMNLMVNARDALPTGGAVTLETTNVSLDDDYVRAHAGATTGPHVSIAVIDEGCGMDESVQAQIFEPFFTTKEPGKGTGLGLSTVFGLVTQSGGHVLVESRLGAGTTFRVLLPIVDADDPSSPDAGVGPGVQPGRETILLVEDDDRLRVIAGNILRSRGYTVVEAKDGREGLALCERAGGTIHLLLTDVVLPRMSGPDLAARLTVSRPELRVLCMSGYTDDSVVRHGLLEGRFAFLEKPITLEALTRKVREVLDAPRP